MNNDQSSRNSASAPQGNRPRPSRPVRTPNMQRNSTASSAARPTSAQGAAGQQTRRPAAGAQRPATGNAPQQRAAAARPAAQRPRKAPVYAPQNPEAELPKKPKTAKRRKGMTPTVLLIVILGVCAALIALTMLALKISGLGYLSYDFKEELTGEEYSINFWGKTDGNGEALSGTIHYADGSSAKLEEGENGNAKITYENGDVYEGPIFHLQKHGEGTLTLACGDVYKGGFAYDELSGKGVYTFASGDVYDGEFVSGQKSGYGVYTWAADSDGNQNRYEGQFSADLRNGEGTFYYADGSVYTGSFKDDKKEDTSGKLVIRNADGSEDIYEGGFVSDMREGTGVYTWANGEVYEGEFKNNLIEGYGVYTWTTGRTYRGYFTAGQIDADKDGYYTDADTDSSSAAADAQ